MLSILQSDHRICYRRRVLQAGQELMQRYISLSDAVVLYGFCFELRNCVFDFQAILGQYPLI
jgi:hypothetical protein